MRLIFILNERKKLNVEPKTVYITSLFFRYAQFSIVIFMLKVSFSMCLPLFFFF